MLRFAVRWMLGRFVRRRARGSFQDQQLQQLRLSEALQRVGLAIDFQAKLQTVQVGLRLQRLLLRIELILHRRLQLLLHVKRVERGRVIGSGKRRHAQCHGAGEGAREEEARLARFHLP